MAAATVSRRSWRGCTVANGEAVGAYSGIGTFGERQVVAASAAIKIDPRTPPEIAALIGCAVTTGIGAVRHTASVQAGESVVVIGLGGVGLSAVIGAVAEGANPVTAIDTSQAKLELAIRAGAHRALLATDADEAAGADHVLECIGLVETVELAIDLVRPGGTVTLVGMTPQGQRASFDVYRFVEEGKTIRGSNYGSADPGEGLPGHRRGVSRGQAATRPADFRADRPRAAGRRVRRDAPWRWRPTSDRLLSTLTRA